MLRVVRCLPPAAGLSAYTRTQRASALFVPASVGSSVRDEEKELLRFLSYEVCFSTDLESPIGDP